jgi:hypothetical protein
MNMSRMNMEQSFRFHDRQILWLSKHSSDLSTNDISLALAGDAGLKWQLARQLGSDRQQSFPAASD